MVTLKRQIEYQTSDPNRHKVLNLKYFYSTQNQLLNSYCRLTEGKSEFSGKLSL